MHSGTQHLIDELTRMTDKPSWEEAAVLGTELVSEDDVSDDRLLLANGDIVEHVGDAWQLSPESRDGISVVSGTTERVHNPGVHATARLHPTTTVDPTARIEAGALIGSHTHVGPHAHVGRSAQVGDHSLVGPGAFVGPNAVVRNGNHIGDGAVIGAGSDIGATTGAGATIGAAAYIDPNSVVAAGDMVAGGRVGPSRARGSQVAVAVERLVGFNRD